MFLLSMPRKKTYSFGLFTFFWPESVLYVIGWLIIAMSFELQRQSLHIIIFGAFLCYFLCYRLYRYKKHIYFTSKAGPVFFLVVSKCYWSFTVISVNRGKTGKEREKINFPPSLLFARGSFPSSAKTRLGSRLSRNIKKAIKINIERVSSLI